ncbi:MAG: M20/M25/M40 family metallo-hydrolase [Sphingomicrobium sp.]
MRAGRFDFRLLSIAVGLLLAFGLKGALIAPPSPPGSVASGQFDTQRAIARLGRILGDQRPHPVDSEANDAVRARLIAELRGVGLQPELREAMDCNITPQSRTVGCAKTRNVVASIGPANGKRLLLNAHYDSTPTGPGASDDGLGLATLIEIAANLRESPPGRPVTFLFNEGEEFGLNGARAFLAHDPLAKEVDSLINIDTRGVNGPALMFETNLPNEPALADYARANRRPYANSVSADFANLIPNTTDVTVFKERGWKTLSYSIIGNETRYHSPGDTVAALDRSSLYHVGSELLAASRVVAADAGGGGRGRMVFTDVAGRWFVQLPLVVAGGLLIAILLGMGFVAGREEALRRPLGRMALATVGSMLGAAVLVALAGFFQTGDYWRAYPILAYLAVYATILIIEAALLARLAGEIDRPRLRIACWLLITILGALFSLALPGASIYFLASPTIALMAMLLDLRSGRLATALFWTAALIQLLLFAELLALVEMLLVDGPMWAVVPLATLAALPVLVETFPWQSSAPTIALLIVGAAGLWIAAQAVPRVSAERPGGLTFSYIRDEITGKSWWAASNKQSPLPGAVASLGNWRDVELVYNGRHRWVTEAPAIDIPRPRIRLLSNTVIGKGRIVRLEIDRAGADAVGLRFDKDVPVLAMGMAGRPKRIGLDAKPGPSAINCTGRSCDRLAIEVRLAGKAPVKARLIGTRFAIPAQASQLLAARPANTQPQYAPDNSVLVRGVTF